MLQKGEIARSLFLVKSMIQTQSENKKKNQSREDSLNFVKIYNMAGNAYQQLQDYSQSFYYYQLALDLSRTLHSSDCIADTYNNLAALFYIKKNYSQAEKYINLALAINIKNKRATQVKQNYNNLGIVHFENRNYQKALYYLQQSFKNTAPNDILDRSLILTNMSQIYYDIQDYNKALSKLEDARNMQAKIPFSPNMLQTELNYMMISVHTGHTQRVKHMMKKVATTIQSVNDPSVKSNSYQYLADVCFAMKDSLQGLHYMMEYVSLRDSIQNDNDNRQLEQYRQLYDMESLRQKNISLAQSISILELKAERRKLFFVGGISFALILAFLLLWILRQRERLRKYEQATFKKQEKAMADEIDYKNRQLTSYTMEQAAGNILSQSIVKNLELLQTGLKKDDYSTANGIIDEIRKEIASYNNQHLGEDFRTYFDQVHPDFLMNLSLSFPQLTNNDLRICAYIHLGLSTKEIAALTFREVRSVESTRNRLRKKLNISTDSSIQSFLSYFYENKRKSTMP